MKKSLVALATMTVVASAFADVDVSGGVKLYGVLDQAVTQQNFTNNSVSTSYQGMYASSATSRLGVKGTRDIGSSGTKAEFQIEQEISPDGNTAMPSKNRGTFVGLSGSGGTIRLGTQETTAYETFSFDANGRVEYKPQVWRYTAASSTQDRANNSIKYISPELSGISLHAMMNYSETSSGAATSATFTSLGAKFHSDDNKLKGVFLVDQITATSFSYILPGQQNVTISTSSAAGTATNIATYASVATSTKSTNPLVRNIASLSYNFDKAYISYIYANAEISGMGGLQTSTFGIRVPYDDFNFALSYGNGSIKSTTTSAIDGSSVTDTTFGAYYNFDKSTSAYFLTSNSTWSYLSASTTVTAIGVRYNF